MIMDDIKIYQEGISVKGGVAIPYKGFEISVSLSAHEILIFESTSSVDQPLGPNSYAPTAEGIREAMSAIDAHLARLAEMAMIDAQIALAKAEGAEP